METVRTRIAPSPTGHFHIGNARTALFSYLFAKKAGGNFVVRIEDTDRARSTKEFEKEILDSLDWLGIAADESPLIGGAFAPYRQSERTAHYRTHLEELLRRGRAFYCFHSEAELEKEKAEQVEKKLQPLHVCTYREADAATIERLHEEGKPSLIRFRTPANRFLEFHDLIRGAIAFESDLIGDFSIAKDLNTPLYNLAVVVDDRAMKISHVIRGEDHISNTPKQTLLWTTLWPDVPMPHYAHLPLILGSDRAKLSSRHGATAIIEFREAGYLSEALVNFMALLGWNPGTEREIFSLTELTEHFDLARVQKSGAVFNIEKLDSLNGEYIRQKSIAELTKLCEPYLEREFSISKSRFPRKYIERIVALEQPRLRKLSELPGRVDYFFRDPDFPLELLRWKKMTDEDIQQSLSRAQDILSGLAEEDFSEEKLEQIFLDAIGKGDRGELLWPLRVALTGRKASPGPFEVMAVLGRERSLAYLHNALVKVSHLGVSE